MRRCLESLRVAFRGREHEVVVVVNGHDRETTDHLISAGVQHYLLPKSTPGAARNLGMEKTKGEWICFLDDDVEVPENYFDQAFGFIEQNDTACIFGGPDMPPTDANPWGRALGYTLSSPLATAKTRFRHTTLLLNSPTEGHESKLILCNLWIKRSLLQRHNLRFDDAFFRNEENVLLYHLRQYRQYYLPHLYVWHNRNTGFWPVCRATAMSGRMRMQSFILFPRSTELIYFVPAIFIALNLLLLPFMGLFPLLFYVIMVSVFAAIWSCQRKELSLWWRVALYHVVINFAYGLGFLFAAPLFFWQKIRRDQ